MAPSDPLSVLKKVPLFAVLSPDEIRDVVAQTSIVHVEAGDLVFSEQDSGDAMYVVVSGEVEIVKALPTGESRILAVLDTRSVFGEMSLLTEETRSAAARARTRASLMKIARDSFRERLARDDLAALKMTAYLASVVAMRLRDMDNDIIRQLTERRERENLTVPLYDIDEARDRVMLQWKL